MSAVAAWATRHAKPVLAAALLLTLGAVLLATQLSTDAGTDTLVDADTASYRATQEVREAFGEEPIVVVAEGDLQQLILTANLGRLLRLEGCLAGDPPRGVEPLPGPCAELAEMAPVESVVGPATFLNEATIQIDRQLRRLVDRVPPDQLRDVLLTFAARYGITSPPSLANPDFLAAVVFDLRRSRGTPKARLSYLFPNRRTTQIIVRLRPDLSPAERSRAIELIRSAVTDETPRAECKFRDKAEPCFQLRGGDYVVSGVPVVIEGVADALKDNLLVLLIVAVLAMALTLLYVFRSRLRLLPLGIALSASALTFGLLELLGGSLTLASISVLPILIGLGVDYAIQFQARYDEAVEGGASGSDAATRAAAAGGPTIAIACLATAAGFLALQLSPTPMVREFGWLLILGISIAFGLALTAGFAALRLRSRAGGSGAPPVAGLFAGRAAALAEWSVRKAGRRVREGHLTLPNRAVGVALALAILGWGVGTQVETVSDIRELAPQDVAAVEDLNEVQELTGVSGELDVAITADDLTDPDTLEWMASFKQRVLDEAGFSGRNPSCLDAELCPGPVLSDLVGASQGGLEPAEVRKTLRQVPAYDLEKLTTLDEETGLPSGTALMSFGIRAQDLDDQQELIERVRGEIGEPGEEGGPPEGVEVELAGVPVIAAQAASDLDASRYWLTLAGLLADGLVLLVAYRSFWRAAVPLVPIVLATGWGALVVWLLGVPLNPMSAALGALTIAIATEFSVLLSARFHEERRAGGDAGEALAAAYSRTGPAVLASGATAIVGFAVLLVSDVRMLRDFGFVTVIDLGAALLAVMIALPVALIWAEERR
ncbi:MAG TPA: MMPL family transporter [Solirubrobacterales bacterium]|nr:MMPL family transporter [Solirubrobacterales bacterium]